MVLWDFNLNGEAQIWARAFGLGPMSNVAVNKTKEEDSNKIHLNGNLEDEWIDFHCLWHHQHFRS